MTGADAVRASVVVATRDRAASLERLVRALDAQTLGRAAFEVVVVDDGSADSTPRLLEACEARAAGPFARFRHERPLGPAAARNRGWRAASGAVVAFTDDDCEPSPGWLEAGLAALADGAGVVAGRTVPAAGAAREPFSRTMEVLEDDGRYPTCNVFYRREALERTGGFDESFRHACAEDTDLAWRARAAGCRTGFAPEALVVHEVRPPDFRRFLRERRRFADQILLVKRHPEARRLFYRRYFYRRSHLHVALSLGIAAAALAEPAAALALPLVWAERFRRTELGSGGLRSAAKIAVGDLWEFAVFAYWSARYRAVLL